ncbi:hypothetical protein RJ641_009102 [Dillenia turbinata]|uniref:Uncharacterized protein n=1 Tax=Dillenia turbinata TaxID=194707 RepID=A0AAN8V749_9MAGN
MAHTILWDMRRKGKKSIMKKSNKQELEEVEILKTVAQAWISHSGSSKPTNEFDAYRLNFKHKPSRFKLEAVNKPLMADSFRSAATWDFGRSLLDSYEIVAVSKRLEAGLVFDDPFSDESIRVMRRRKESKNSLRNLFNRTSSKEIQRGRSSS